MHNLVRDEGVIGSACPVFVSLPKGGLKRLRGLGLCMRVIRAEDVPKSKPASKLLHPEGGEPPMSIYRPGRTVWKWTIDSLSKPVKQWIEFDRRSGWPAEDLVEVYSEIYDWSDMEEDNNESSGDTDDDMPGLEDTTT